MTKIVEKTTGLEFIELSHPFGHDMPMVPGYADVSISRPVTHAKHGVMSHRLKMTMHAGTHVNAPIHLIQGGRGVGDLDLHHFFGSGVVLKIPKTKWELVTAEDLRHGEPRIEAGDIVVIDTGWHKRYSDSQEYFGHAPGLGLDAAEFLVEKKARLVGVDTPFIDHPLATSMGEHRNGPQMQRLPDEYRAQTGREPKQDFPDWNPAHRCLLHANIPTIENVGGSLGTVSGVRCAFHAYPWRWPGADACMIRFVAIRDPAGSYRVATGEESEQE